MRKNTAIKTTATATLAALIIMIGASWGTPEVVEIARPTATAVTKEA